MASKKMICELLAAIKTMYPYYGKDSDETVCNMWMALMNEITDATLSGAFMRCLKRCKTPPTPADVFEEINKQKQSIGRSDAELWGIYKAAIDRTADEASCLHFTRVMEDGRTQGDHAMENIKQLFKSLPREVMEYIGGYSDLIHIALNYTDIDITFERQRFIKAMPQIRERVKHILDFENGNELYTGRVESLNGRMGEEDM